MQTFHFIRAQGVGEDVMQFAYRNGVGHVGGGAKHRAACSVAVGAMQVVSRSQRAPKFDLASIALTPTGGATAP